jgi:hypothetical protein
MLWQLQLVLYLNYVLQSPAGFEANLIHLELAHSKSLSDPRLKEEPTPHPQYQEFKCAFFAMEMKDRRCPPYVGEPGG